LRWVLLLILATTLAGAAAWLLLGEDDAGTESAGEAERGLAADRSGPALEGSRRAATSTQPGVNRGRCSLHGRVTRGGDPARATVEAHLAPARAWDNRPGLARAYYEGRLRTPAAASAVAPAAHATSDAEGRFLLEGLGQGSYDLVARAEDGTRAHRLVDLRADGVRVGVELALETPGLLLRGRAHFTDGRPVAGRVAAWAPIAGELDAWEVTPAAVSEAEIAPNGSFTLVDLLPGRHVVRVFLADGGVALAPLVDVPSDEIYDVSVAQLPITMHGRVQSEPGSDPVPGAWVVLYQGGDTDTCATLVRAVTDADGRFSLRGPEADAYLLVEALGQGARWFTVPDPAEEIVLRLPLPARIEGRVLAKEDGRPAAGARVLALDSEGDGALDEARADADGRYALTGVSPGLRQVVVLGGGWASPGLGTEDQDRRERTFTVDVPAGRRITHDLVAERSVRIEGATLGADGKPVGGACVEVSAMLVGDDEDWELRQLLAADRVASAPDGSFAFEDLPAGAVCRLAAWAPGEAPVLLVDLDVRPPGPVRAEVRFPHGTLLDVRVVGHEDGGPIAGAIVAARVEGVPTGADVTGMALTGSDGRARLGPVGDADVTVSATAAGAQVQLGLGKGDGVGSGGIRSVELRLRRGFTVRGTVQRADGSPAAGAFVKAHAVEDGATRNLRGSAGFDGGFRIEGLTAGRWILGAGLDDASSEPLVVDAGAEGVLLRLGEAPPKGVKHTRRLVVVDPAGRPVPSFRVSARSPNGNSHTLEGWEGRAELVSHGEASVAAGFGTVEVYDARGGDGQPLDLAPARVDVPDRGEGDVEVRLGPGHRIEGRVLKPDGSPAWGTRIVANLVPRAGSEEGVRVPFQDFGVEMHADTDGRFRLMGLAEARYRLTAEAPPGCAPPREAPEVDAGARDVELRLRQAVTARVRVLTWDGRVIPDARVFTEHAGDWNSERTDDEGRVVFVDLDPEATWKLSVSPPDGMEDALPLEISPWRPADGDLRLERGRSVAGHVRDPAGAPVEAARVSRLEHDGGAAEDVFTDAAGAFRFGAVPPGAVLLRAWPPRVGTPPEADGHVDAATEPGKESVVLTVNPGHVVRLRLTERPKGDDGLEASILTRSPEGEMEHNDVSESAQRGLFRLGGLEPETAYTFWLRVDATHYALAEFDGRATEVVVPVREGRSIRGRIVGFPLGEQAMVLATSSRGIQVQTYTNREGRYVFEGLPPGPWQIRISVGDDDDRRTASGETEAGTTLDLALQPDATR
jgi:hypothetical protein